MTLSARNDAHGLVLALLDSHKGTDSDAIIITNFL